MKILGGRFRGRNFYMPAGIRPTQSVTRQAVFDLIGNDLSGVAFLDLFAGSGAVGLEAFSRGARKVTFVERAPKCLETIEENLRLLGVGDAFARGEGYEVLAADTFAAVKMFARKARKFDVVFLDPPYEAGLVKKALKSLMAYDILHPNCYIIAEHSKKAILPEPEGRFSLIKQRKYGKSFLAVFQGR